jgi:hypothetical protein
MNNRPQSRRFTIGKILEKWWFKLFEAVAFVLLLTKLLPEKWLENIKETGWGLIILLGISVLSLLFINYLLTLGYAKEIANREQNFSDTISEIVENNNKKISELNKEIVKLEKNARYADVIPMLNIAFQELHNAIRRNHADKRMYHEYFEKCCQSLEKVFSRVTGVDCHVCIKMTSFTNDQIPSHSKVEKRVNNLEMKTYCRSLHLSNARIQIDQSKVSHPITENTDFEDVFMKKGDCFFCNDLTEKDEYKNSSVKPQNHGSYFVFPKGTSREHKINNWPLPYRATIVAPILPTVKETSEERIILGMLCVDSKEPNVFNEDLDKHIMIGCADGLYNSFKKLFVPYNPSVKTKPQPQQS